MENIFIIWLSLFQAQGTSASVLYSDHVLLQMSYYDAEKKWREDVKTNLERNSVRTFRLKRMPCQLRMRRVTQPVNSTTLNTAILLPKNLFHVHSANSAKYWCHERFFVAQWKKPCFCERFVNLKCSRIKIRVTFFSLPILEAVCSKT